MRISSTKIWLASALALGTGTARRESEPALVFNVQDFDQFGNYDPTPVLVVDILRKNVGVEVPLSKTFGWTTSNPSLVIERVKLYALNEETGKGRVIGEKVAETVDHKTLDGHGVTTGSGLMIVPTPTETENLGITSTTNPFLPKRQTDGPWNPSQKPLELDVYSGATEGSVTITDVTQLTRYYPSPLYFGVVWLGDTGDKGETFSRAFAVAQTVDDAIFIIRGSTRYSNTSSVFSERLPGDGNTVTPTGHAPGTGGSAAAVPTDNVMPAPSQAGLATGAIIGIAVACGILGLLLILGGIWFLIRRRNKRAGNAHLGSPGGPYGKQRSRTDDLIAEKEASAGGADPSPHSPYSDDGVVLVPSAGHTSTGTYQNGGVAMGTPAAAPMLPQQIPQLPHPPNPHHQQAGPYATYSDRGSISGVGGSPSTHAASITHSTHDDITRAGMGSPTAGGRATPHSSLSPQYAHLVEEGMTEDEIRRLEDEERQLDAEIERAGRR
ncbi:hypothetical protein V8F20_006505 [Naviculisporaceae sp. PSN 640]